MVLIPSGEVFFFLCGQLAPSSGENAVGNMVADNVNFNEDDPKIIIHVRPMAWRNRFKDTIFTFTNVIRCSRLRLWVGYLTYFKFTRVSSIVHLGQLKKQIGS